MEYKNTDTGFYETVKGKDGASDVRLTDGLYIQGVSAQDRLTALIQTQNGVNILPNTWHNSAWIDSFVEGSALTHLGISASMTGGTGMAVQVTYSHDGVNHFGSALLTHDGTGVDFGTTEDIKLAARYFRINIKNKDVTNPKVTNAYAYLKA